MAASPLGLTVSLRGEKAEGARAEGAKAPRLLEARSVEDWLGRAEKAFAADVGTTGKGVPQIANSCSYVAGSEDTDKAKYDSTCSTDVGSQGLLEEAISESGHDEADEALSTVMISDLPCCIQKQQLADALNSNGFEGRYDQLIIPRSFRPRSNLGYSFVNFITSADAERCMQVFNGYKFPGTRSKKRAKVSFAHRQDSDKPATRRRGVAGEA